MNLLSSATVFSFFTLISRFLGYIRDILIAFFLGASIYADAFFVAFRLPNTFRRLFAEGTFNAAFIPSYTKEKIKGSLNGKRFADDVLFLLIVTLLAIIFITIIGSLSLSFIGKKILKIFNDILKRIPILRTIYSAIGQMTETLAPKKDQRKV